MRSHYGSYEGASLQAIDPWILGDEGTLITYMYTVYPIIPKVTLLNELV